MHLVASACLTAILACAATAQSTSPLSLTLATKDGRTQFRMGEEIDVELRFEATEPGRFRLSSSSIERRFVRDPEYDSFTAEPTVGARDPLFDSGTIMGGTAGAFQQALGTKPVIVPAILNDWVSFRKPGRYRIVASSRRVFSGDRQPARIALRSNAVEIEIVDPEPGWRERQLQEAVAVLEAAQAAGSKPGIGNEDAVRRAARILRFLETAEAVPHLVRFFEQGLPAAQEDLRAGLLGSPYRDKVIAAMEQAIEAPDVPITYYWIGTLMQLEYARRFGPRGDRMPQDDPDALKRWMEADRVYMERFKPIEEQYDAKLAQAIPRKRGVARAVCLQTLLRGGSQAMRGGARKVLVREFAGLPEDVQWSLLMEWQQIGGPDLEPALTTVAAKPGRVRETALERLLEINPAAARRMILDRIRRGDLGDSRSEEPRALLFLPDERLPQLEDALVAALDKGAIGPALVARYATEAVLPQVMTWLERNPHEICGPISAYLFRVDAAYARLKIAEARRGGGGCLPNIP